MQGYANSKLLNVIFANELQRRIDASAAYKGKVLLFAKHRPFDVLNMYQLRTK
jgi:hypothetical protein